MINVNNATKTAYLSDSIPKQLTVYFPDLNITLSNTDLLAESFSLTERATANDSIEFVGCIASVAKFTTTSLTENVSGEKVIISIQATGTDVESINLFTGYVESVEQQAHSVNKEITAYDPLYNLGQFSDVADWYRLLSFPISLKNFRDSLFAEIGITQVNTTLPLDTLVFDRAYDPATMNPLDVIKSICQLNCVFGKINYDGEFEYITPPSSPLTSDEYISYYKSGTYQEYTVQPVNKLVIRVDETDYICGGGTNKYIIQDNFFFKNLSDEKLQDIADTLYPEISGFSYVPFSFDTNGLPYVECLDVITLPVRNLITDEFVDKDFLILERTLSGIQALRDNFVAEGDEYQHEFITSISVDIDELRQAIEIIRNDLENLGFKYYMITNTSDIDIGDTEDKVIIDLRFQATKSTVTVFNAEILLEGDSTVNDITYDDIKGIFTYVLDSSDIVDYKPTEIWVDGEHICHLLYYFNITDTSMRHLQVRLKASGGSIHIDTANLRGSLYGQNLYATDNWDGILFIEEDMGLVKSTINTELNHTNTMTEDVESGYYPTTPASFTDNMYGVVSTLSGITATTTMTETLSIGGEE